MFGARADVDPATYLIKLNEWRDVFRLSDDPYAPLLIDPETAPPEDELIRTGRFEFKKEVGPSAV